jgi:hypothetical protein
MLLGSGRERSWIFAHCHRVSETKSSGRGRTYILKVRYFGKKELLEDGVERRRKIMAVGR